MELEREKKYANGLGIASIVFGIVGILTICGCGIGFFFGLIGVILGILGLTVLKRAEKYTAVAGLIVSGIALVFGCFWMFLYIPKHKDAPSLLDYATESSSDTTPSSSSDFETKPDTSSSTTTSSTVKEDKEEKKEETPSSNIKDTIKTVGVNEEFGNDTITGKVIDYDLDYKNYNDVWTTVPEGKKCIYIKIKVTNISSESNYVSVGDFDCYIDDVKVMPEWVNGSDDDDYNNNIEPGRSAILGALYVVPKNCSSIELEYNPWGEYAERVIIKIQ